MWIIRRETPDSILTSAGMHHGDLTGPPMWTTAFDFGDAVMFADEDRADRFVARTFTAAQIAAETIHATNVPTWQIAQARLLQGHFERGITGQPAPTTTNGSSIAAWQLGHDYVTAALAVEKHDWTAACPCGRCRLDRLVEASIRWENSKHDTDRQPARST